MIVFLINKETTNKVDIGSLCQSDGVFVSHCGGENDLRDG